MILEKEMKAITGEKSQYLVHDFNDNTIRFVLNYPGEVDRDVLKKAVEAVVYSVDVLHGRFLVEKGKAIWRIYRDVEEEEYFRFIRVEKDAEQAGYEQAILPIKPEGPVKLRCALIWDGRVSSVAVCISHMVADGGDGKYLLGKLIEAYNRILETGSAQGLNVKNGSRAPEQLYAHLNKKGQRKLWKNPMPGTMNEFPFADAEPGTPRVLRRGVARDVMGKAREKAKRGGMTANDLVLAACYQAFAAVPGVDEKRPIGVMAMMDLRKHCPGGDSEGLTNMAGSLKTVKPEGVTGSFEETLAEIARQTREDKEDPMSGLEGVPMLHTAMRTAPMGLLLKVAPAVYGNMSIGVTNLGNLKGEDWRLGSLVPVSGMLGGPLKKKPGVQVSVLSVDGECALSIVGEYTDDDVVRLEKMLEDMVEIIRGYGEN